MEQAANELNQDTSSARVLTVVCLICRNDRTPPVIGHQCHVTGLDGHVTLIHRLLMVVFKAINGLAPSYL